MKFFKMVTKMKRKRNKKLRKMAKQSQIKPRKRGGLEKILKESGNVLTVNTIATNPSKDLKNISRRFIQVVMMK